MADWTHPVPYADPGISLVTAHTPVTHGYLIVALPAPVSLDLW